MPYKHASKCMIFTFINYISLNAGNEINLNKI